MPIGDAKCRCPEGPDLFDVRQRCQPCRFEACELFTYTEAPDAAHYDTAEEAVSAFSEQVDPILVPEVVIYGYQRKKIDPALYKHLPKRVLADLLERLHEEYGDWDENYKPCDNMKQAAQDFVDLVLDHYKVWQAERSALASDVFKTKHRKGY
jgi:hypothetical protein